MSKIDPLQERRQRAFDVADEGPGDQYTYRDVENAVAEATRVQITPEAIWACVNAPGPLDKALSVFLAALGFEVVE